MLNLVTDSACPLFRNCNEGKIEGTAASRGKPQVDAEVMDLAMYGTASIYVLTEEIQAYHLMSNKCRTVLSLSSSLVSFATCFDPWGAYVYSLRPGRTLHLFDQREQLVVVACMGLQSSCLMDTV